MITLMSDEQARLVAACQEWSNVGAFKDSAFALSYDGERWQYSLARWGKTWGKARTPNELSPLLYAVHEAAQAAIAPRYWLDYHGRGQVSGGPLD